MENQPIVVQVPGCKITIEPDSATPGKGVSISIGDKTKQQQEGERSIYDGPYPAPYN